MRKDKVYLEKNRQDVNTRMKNFCHEKRISCNR